MVMSGEGRLSEIYMKEMLAQLNLGIKLRS